ncbi:MAG TPA: polysaccharide deacetylase family protein [Thermoanaerobaculia bacterium]|nr:polysaccharide deacetylase family protein [Thermoanaerobaculia bacterium]
MAPVALVLLWPTAPVAAIGVVALSHALLLYPVLRPNVQWLGPVVTHFATARKEVWLTIDDGPTGDTPAVLDLFDRHDVKATFFVKGELAEQFPEAAQEILRRGHSLANHSHTHPAGSFWCSPPGRVAHEIDGCNRAITSIAGAPPRWFRAPVGMKNPAVHPTLARRGMRLIGWTARGFDAVRSDPREILARILPHLRPGAIIVLHQGRDHSVRVLEHVIVALKERGYRFVIPEDEQLRTSDER